MQKGRVRRDSLHDWLHLVHVNVHVHVHSRPASDTSDTQLFDEHVLTHLSLCT